MQVNIIYTLKRRPNQNQDSQTWVDTQLIIGNPSGVNREWYDPNFIIENFLRKNIRETAQLTRGRVVSQFYFALQFHLYSQCFEEQEHY